ncbi:TIGR03943 family putative permease subunit [Effusibacillus consociatus]|uniref:TIGR03943 family putative permease subunit n=1 Tax=Effusibacillus consociatus TaxID=1117041 RepID=A0ABV9PYB3_9BACL
MIHKMRVDAGRFIQGIILSGFTALLLKLFWTGEIRKLVAPHMMVLLAVTVGVLIMMTAYAFLTMRCVGDECCHEHGENCGHDHDHDHRVQKIWAVLILPVVLGMAVPTQSLGTSMLSSGMYAKPANAKTVDLASVPKVKVEGASLPAKPETGSEVSMYEVMNNILIVPENYFNQRYKYTGFVYHPDGWPENRMVIMRYVMVHCAADTLPVGVTVEVEGASKYKNDTWIQIDATLSTRKSPEIDQVPPVSWYYGYEDKPVLEAHEIKIIDEPKEPYLYPFGKTGISGGN